MLTQDLRPGLRLFRPSDSVASDDKRTGSADRKAQSRTSAPHFIPCGTVSPQGATIVAGFYKRGCQEKTLLPSAGSRDSCLTSSPFRHPWRQKSAVLWSFSCPRYDITPGSEGCTSLTVAIGQPWFYLRLAPRRGTMALLGCPREHMVPRETWRQWRTQPNPARILTLEPERSEPVDDRGHDSGMVFRICALKRLVASDSRRRRLLLSSRHAK